jgi:hypothetical protein
MPEVLRLAREGKADAYALATLYGALGDKDRAFEWFDKALSSGGVTARLIRYDPQLDPLRSDQRFAESLRRHGRERLLSEPAG